MADPPFETGAVHDTTDCWLPLDVALTPVGAPATVDGVAAADGLEAALVPSPLVAVTTKVYDVPLVSPDTVQLVAPVVVQVKLPGVEVTV